MHEAEDADADHAPHTSPAAAHVLVQLSPRSPACQLNPWPPHVTSTGGEVGGGVGGGGSGGGDSGGAPVVPPPHVQHITEAVKSLSS